MSLTINWRNETLVLLPEKAILWPAQSTLLVADVHLGKDTTFRQHGLAIPAGNTADDLQTMTQLIEQHQVSRLLILGDFFHHHIDPLSNDWRMLQAFVDYHNQAQTSARIEVVAGNHDRHRAEQNIEGLIWHEEDLVEGPFVFAHHPVEKALPDNRFQFAGHIHPTLRLNAGHDRMRVPVFWFRPYGVVLPSFGSMTGGYNIRPHWKDKVYLVGPDAVVALPH